MYFERHLGPVQTFVQPGAIMDTENRMAGTEHN